MSAKNVSCYSASMVAASVFSWIVGVIISFSAVARGAHDIWAASAVYLAVLTLGIVAAFHFSSNRNKGLVLPLWPALAVLLTFLFLSYIDSVNPSESYLELMDWVSAIFMFFIAANIFRNDGDLDVVYGFVAIVLWFEAVYCLYQFYSVWQPEKFGSLINANALAAFVIPWVPVYLSKIIETWRDDRRVAWFWLSGLIAASFCLAVGRSTSAYLCLLIGMPFLLGFGFLSRLFRRHPIIISTVLACLAFAFAWTIYEKLTHVYAAELNRPQGSVFWRLYWWKSAMNMFVSHPFFGVGLGNFPSAYLAYKEGNVQNTLFAHSFIFELLGETGLLGISALVLFWGSWFCFALKRSPHSHRRSLIQGLTLLLMFSSFNLGIEYLVNLLVLFFLAGAAIAPLAEKRIRFRFSVLLLLVAGAIALIPEIVCPFLASRESVSGQSYFLESNLDEAERNFNSAIHLDPRSWESHRGLAQIAWQRYLASKDGKYLQTAIEHQQRAIRFNRLNGKLQQELNQLISFSSTSSS